jgi:hypothetical protein
MNRRSENVKLRMKKWKIIEEGRSLLRNVMVDEQTDESRDSEREHRLCS